MIIDSSAIIAIICREPGYEELVTRLREDDATIGAPTLVETGLVLEARFGLDAHSVLARFLQDFAVAVIPFGELHSLEAIDAYRRFGRGRHPAALNFGDCLSYATARLASQPLLFVGDDFTKTDIPAA